MSKTVKFAKNIVRGTVVRFDNGDSIMSGVVLGRASKGGYEVLSTKDHHTYIVQKENLPIHRNKHLDPFIVTAPITKRGRPTKDNIKA